PPRDTGRIGASRRWPAAGIVPGGEVRLERIYITGTDTDVGKSVVTACLAQALAASGAAVRAVKPVASGVEPGTAGEDASLLAAAAGHEPVVFASFEAPLSPHRAARLEGRRVEPEALIGWLLGLRGEPLLVEGVGGWRVPLTERLELVDLVRRAPGPL